MVLDMEHAPDVLTQPVQADVRRITDPNALSAVRSVLEPVWNEDFTGLISRLAADLRDNPDYLIVFAAYADNIPVSVGWVGFLPGNAFGALWGGSTLPAYRGQGFYKAMLAARLQAAREKGCRFLTVDAGPMSRPILLRLGFEHIATAYACIWHYPQPETGQ
jgi:GNAT superfamily N-acetyltransferase